MSEPTTEAGRALLDAISSEMGYFSADPSDRAEMDKWRARVAAIEEEARDAGYAKGLRTAPLPGGRNGA